MSGDAQSCESQEFEEREKAEGEDAWELGATLVEELEVGGLISIL